jgi:hypothetical protein
VVKTKPKTKAKPKAKPKVKVKVKAKPKTNKGRSPIDGVTFKKNVHNLVEHPWFGFYFF